MDMDTNPNDLPPFEPRPVVLEAGPVRLEPLTIQHAEGVAAVGGDASTFNHLPDGPFATREEAAAWIERALADAERYGTVPFAIIDLRGDEPRLIGSTRFLHVRPRDRSLEIGWTWLAPAARGTGINSAVKYLLLKHAIEDLGAVRVAFKTDARNLQSQRALTSVGAIQEGTLRRHRRRRDGTWRDSVYFSITDQDWPQVRERLEPRIAGLSAGT